MKAVSCYWVKLLSFALYFFCFSPFIFPFPGFTTDIQPYSLLIAFVLLITNIKRLYISKGLKLLCAYSCFSVMVGLFSIGDSFTIVKCIYSYISLFCVTWAVYNSFIWNGEINEKLYKIIILLWLIVGLMQIFVFPDFAKSFVSGGRTTLDRGAFGLASEPSFYGVQCFYFLYVIQLFQKERILYMLIVLFMAFVLAQSFTGMMFVIAFVIPFMVDSFDIKKVSIRKLFYIFLGGGIFLFLFRNFLVSKRIGYLFDVLFQNKAAIILEDESAGIRFQTILDALKLSFNHSFLPLGYTERVGSMYGGILQEFGFLGIPLMVYIAYSFSCFYNSLWAKLLSGILLFAIFFSTVQLSNPMIAFIIALGIYNKRREVC